MEAQRRWRKRKILSSCIASYRFFGALFCHNPIQYIWWGASLKISSHACSLCQRWWLRKRITEFAFCHAQWKLKFDVSTSTDDNVINLWWGKKFLQLSFPPFRPSAITFRSTLSLSPTFSHLRNVLPLCVKAFWQFFVIFLFSFFSELENACLPLSPSPERLPRCLQFQTESISKCIQCWGMRSEREKREKKANALCLNPFGN